MPGADSTPEETSTTSGATTSIASRDVLRCEPAGKHDPRMRTPHRVERLAPAGPTERARRSRPAAPGRARRATARRRHRRGHRRSPAGAPSAVTRRTAQTSPPSRRAHALDARGVGVAMQLHDVEARPRRATSRSRRRLVAEDADAFRARRHAASIVARLRRRRRVAGRRRR